MGWLVPSLGTVDTDSSLRDITQIILPSPVAGTDSSIDQHVDCAYPALLPHLTPVHDTSLPTSLFAFSRLLSYSV